MPETKPTHVYVARKDCGCVIGLVTDLRDKSTGEGVAEFIGDGYTVSREDWQTYKDRICKEETFMACPHGQMSLVQSRG